MHTSTLGIKFGSLIPSVTLKIRSRSPKPNQLFIMSQCYIHANLVKIHPPVHKISCKQSVTLTPNANADANRIRTKNNMSPSPSVGDIIMMCTDVNIYRVMKNIHPLLIKFIKTNIEVKDIFSVKHFLWEKFLSS